MILDIIIPWALVAIWLIIMILPEDEDIEDVGKRKNEEINRRIREWQEMRCEYIDYGAFKGLSDDEFARLPRSLKLNVPDKCRWCRGIICCDPLEMALAREYCERFKE